MPDEPVSLEFISRQFDRMMSEISLVRDEMRVQTAIVMRIERRMDSLDLRMERIESRLRGVEEPMRSMVTSISGSMTAFERLR